MQINESIFVFFGCSSDNSHAIVCGKLFDGETIRCIASVDDDRGLTLCLFRFGVDFVGVNEANVAFIEFHDLELSIVLI